MGPIARFPTKPPSVIRLEINCCTYTISVKECRSSDSRGDIPAYWTRRIGISKDLQESLHCLKPANRPVIKAELKRNRHHEHRVKKCPPVLPYRSLAQNCISNLIWIHGTENWAESQVGSRLIMTPQICPTQRAAIS